ncbi:MAG: T9SS type A sorting domain-containing protein [Candidatus Marinimicrobia bacterium]|nr:T9SS type A sorting domain-containing protein [Candidatus Neomarinimicrobiota bacterium]
MAGFTDSYGAGANDVWLLRLAPAAPHISSVMDVPDDQGRQVYVSWNRSYMDLDAGIIQYGIKLQNPEGQWVSLGSVAAEQAETYTYLADTFGDSSATGTVWSRFQVTAHSDDPAIFYTSPVDSGYSIDNLAPMTPSGLMASMADGLAVSLTWNGPVDHDFDFFRLYRMATIDTAAMSLVETSETSFTDTTVEASQSYEYWLTAVDINGNESDQSQALSVTVLGIEDAPGLPAEFALHTNYPNPFNPATTLRFDLPEAAVEVRLVVYDLLGREVARLLDRRVEPGYHQVTWDGRDRNGRQLPTGVYIARLTVPGYAKSIKLLLLR